MTAWADLLGSAYATAGGPSDAVDGQVPGWVVRPGSVAEVQACVAAAAREGQAIVASGLGAHLDVGAPPARLDVLLRLDRLDRVVDHQPGDMTVTVQAGCPLPTLERTLGAASQWLPLDPPRFAQTTVGGLVAAGFSGPLRSSQGRPRDLLLGLRVVGSGGELVAGGGRVVKNVAGYDLPKLHVGALGTLGVIVDATFKVRPRPEREEAVAVACGSGAEALDLGHAVNDSDAAPMWIAVTIPGELAGPHSPAALAVGLGGLPEENAAARERVIGLAAARGLRTLAVPGGTELRRRLGEFSAEPGAAVLRAAVLPTELEAVLDGSLPMRCVADVGCGVARLATDGPDAAGALLGRLRPEIEARGGSLVVERASAAMKAALDVWGDPGPGLPLMRRLKAALDPDRIFAPGRFVGGI